MKNIFAGTFDRLAGLATDGRKSMLPFTNTGGSGGLPYGSLGWFSSLPGGAFDYRREAGILWECCPVMICLNWLIPNYNAADPCVRRRVNGKWIITDNHPGAAVVEYGNEFYDGATLMTGTIISLKTFGNSYWFKVRSASEAVVGLIYLPHWMVFPRWGGGRFIDFYEYRVDGKTIPLPTSEIVHIREMMDPLNPRMGMAPLNAALREVCTINEASTFAAAIMRNMGVPGAIISPDGPQAEFSPEQRKQVKKLWREHFTNEHAGDPLVASIPIKVENPGYSPEQLVLDKVNKIPESRICAIMGPINPMVVALNAGDKPATYNNQAQTYKQAIQSALYPMWGSYGRQITRQLPELFGKRDRFGYDVATVPGLQEEETDLYERLEVAAGGPFMSVNEARGRANLDPAGPEHDEIRQSGTSSTDGTGKEGDGKKPADEETDEDQ